MNALGKRIAPALLAAALIGISPLVPAQSSAWQALSKEAMWLYQTGQPEASLVKAKEALRLTEKELGPDSLATNINLQLIGMVSIGLGRFDEAEQAFKRSIAVIEKARGTEARGLAMPVHAYAAVIFTRGRYAEAEPIIRRALRLTEQEAGPDSVLVSEVVDALADTLERLGRLQEAEPLYKRKVAIIEKANGVQSPSLASALVRLARVQTKLGSFAEADFNSLLAMDICNRSLGDSHLTTGMALTERGRLLLMRNAWSDADPLLQRALNIREQFGGPDNPELLDVLAMATTAASRLGDMARAEALALRQVAIAEKAFADKPPLASALGNLCGNLRDQARYAEAEGYCRQALDVWLKALGAEHPQVAMARVDIGRVRAAQGDQKGAEALYRHALPVIEKGVGPHSAEAADVLEVLAESVKAQGRASEAAMLAKRAEGIRGAK